jgi:hypothetical protein
MPIALPCPALPRLATPSQATPRLATPSHAPPRLAKPRLATPCRAVNYFNSSSIFAGLIAALTLPASNFFRESAFANCANVPC